jgi:hypothetical protein
VFQVADRRLTRGDGTLYDDDSTKNVILNAYAFGYAGLAALEGRFTHDWLVTNTVGLSTRPIQEILEHIRVRASEAVRARSAPKLSQHLALIGVGSAAETEAATYTRCS